VNSGVFAAAIFATPLFGLLADRVGHRALMLTFGTLLLPITFIVLGLTDLNPWISTVLMGLSFALVPAINADGVELCAGAGDHLALHDTHRRSAAPRHRARRHHAAAAHRSLGLEPHRRLARRQGGRGSCESCGLCDDVVVLRPPEPHRTHVRGAAVAARDGSAWPWARARASARRLVVEPAEIQDPPHARATY